MLASTKDELGNTTSFTYSTDFAGAYLTQTNLADIQMPDTGAPLVHHQTSASYDYNTGLMTSATDENGNPFTYQYDTARLLLRQANHNTTHRPSATNKNDNPFTYHHHPPPPLLTQANHPDQGSTKYFYPNPTTVERQRAIDSSHYDDYFVHFDGLGRPIQTQQITPTCTVLVDTTYDAAGHV